MMRKRPVLIKPAGTNTNGGGGEEEHPVEPLASIPDMSYAKEYVGRSIDGKSEMDVLDMALANSFNVLIEGPTGPGKTSAVMAWCALRTRKFYAIPCNVGIEPSQMFGKMVADPARRWWSWQDGPATDIVRHGGTLLINEVNAMPERVAMALFALLDKRREIMLLDHKGEVVRAHRPPVRNSRGKVVRSCWCPDGPDCPPDRWVLIVGDMNPDYEGTRPLNKALRNRFAVQLWWDYDRQVEEQLITSTVLLDIAWALREQIGQFDTPVTTNMLQEFERMVAATNLEFAISNFVQHFGIDERTSVRDVFKAKAAKLEDDFVAPSDDGFDEIFTYDHSRWMVAPAVGRRK